MSIVGSIQIFLFVAIAVIGLAIEIWALVDAARHTPATYSAAGKLTKGKWVAILIAAVLVGFLGIPPPIGVVSLPIILTLAAVVPAGIYLADVRPALRQYGGGSRRPPRSW